MKSTSTIYKGILFRSALEARWAMWFDEYGLGWEWEYEPFKLLGKGYCYTPDFLITKGGVRNLVEIKPSLEIWDKALAQKVAIQNMAQALIFRKKNREFSCFFCIIGYPYESKIHMHLLTPNNWWLFSGEPSARSLGVLGLDLWKRS